jgi:excisionase family DNA binding protein
VSELLSVSEASRELQVSTDTIRQWADTGKLPAMRTSGGQRIFRREDIARAVANKKAAAIEQRSAAR